ncbi:hypothetical protein Tco_0518326, partial [Tanacetum coccineum]
DINHFRHFLVTLENLYPMDDEPMWAANHVVASTPGSAITIPETANEFCYQRDTKNEVVRLMMFPLSLTGEAKTWLDELNEGRNAPKLPWSQSVQRQYSKGHTIIKNLLSLGLSEITQEVLNAAAGGIFLYKTPNQAYQLLEDKVLLKLDWAKNQKTNHLLKNVAFAYDEIFGSSNSNIDKIMATT